VKDAKHIFLCAMAHSESMIVDRILVRVLPELMAHGQMLTTETIDHTEHIWVPEALYEHIRAVAEELVGLRCVDR
jgi:hypothetical protein